MIASIGSRYYSAESTLLVSLAVLSVCYALFQSNETEELSSSSGGSETIGFAEPTASIPFPGPEWIDRMTTFGGPGGEEDSTISLRDGRTFSNAYAAILDGDPLGNPCRNFNAWVNSMFFSSRVASWFIRLLGDNAELAHYALCYLRNFVGAMVVYYGTAGIFHYFCYVHPVSRTIFEEQRRTRPSWETIKGQIKLSQASMTIYTLLPVLDEYLIESGYTKAYFTIEEIGGWTNHIMTMLFYFFCVEIGIYWMHRTLHTNKFLYKHVHLMHHEYNKAETLTPWASIAFHPLDGMLQASPYVYMLPFVPCHYLTHFAMLFFTAIWATYIHDAMDWNVDPVMGSKYHTVHHTHYIYNYGQIFIFCDWFWGTLKIPDGPTGIKNANKLNKKKVS